MTAGSTTIQARDLVVACGAWSKHVLRDLGHPLPLSPFRAQACRLRPQPLAGPVPSLHDEDLDLYVRPLAPGRLLVGDGTGRTEVDPDRSHPEADASFAREVRGRLATVFPGWSSAVVEESWAGTCVASPDAYPFVGPVPSASRLFVATGFNGLGAMRAGGLARRLATGMAEGSWGPLRPADPGRFPSPLQEFDPRPDFSVASPASSPLDGPSSAIPVTGAEPWEVAEPSLTYRSLQLPEEAASLALPPISPWFDPFIPFFLKEALRAGGQASVAFEAEEAVGAYLFSASERSGSVFTRCRGVADHFRAQTPPGELYTEHPFWPGGHPVQVMMADLRDWRTDRPLRYPIRVASTADLALVKRLIQEVQGPVDERWFATFPRAEEVCFLCEIDGMAVGVSWLTVVGPYGRGHSFAVHPRYRGMGIGTDMLMARMLWLRSRGARQVVSEIYGGNQASRVAAERAGMAPVGRMFAYRLGKDGEVLRPRSAGPRTAGRPSPSSR